MPFSTLSINTVPRRLALGAAAFTLLVWAIYSVAAGFANGTAVQAETIDEAIQAAGLAPGDPQAEFAAAALLDRSFEPGDFERALGYYERAAETAPHDYRYWLELGRAYDRRGEAERAEAALRYARSLAPNYASVKWALGNMLLRQGRSAEAFELIREAVAGDPKYTDSAAALAWQMNEGDVNGIRAAVGDSVRLNAALAGLFAQEERFDEAVSAWTALPEADRRSTLKDIGAGLFGKLIEARRYRMAAAVAADLWDGEAPAAGRIYNGGFELPIKASNALPFDWQLGSGQHPQIGPTEGQKSAGAKSLVLLFNSPDRVDELRGLMQVVPVEPGRTYVLRFDYRAAIDTAAAFRWNITAPAGGSIAVSEPLDTRTEWKQSSVRFTVPGNTDGVLISFGRDACTGARCTVSGTLWLDEVVLSAE